MPERRLLCCDSQSVYDLCVYVIVCSSVMQILQLAYFMIFVSLDVTITY